MKSEVSIKHDYSEVEHISLESINTEYLNSISKMLGRSIATFQCLKKEINDMDAIYRMAK